jgi:hypothetical protein
MRCLAFAMSLTLLTGADTPLNAIEQSPPQVSLKEDCLPYDPTALRLEPDFGGTWLLTEARQRAGVFRRVSPRLARYRGICGTRPLQSGSLHVTHGVGDCSPARAPIAPRGAEAARVGPPPQASE